MTWPNLRKVWYLVTSMRGILKDEKIGNHVAFPAIFFSQRDTKGERTLQPRTTTNNISTIKFPRVYMREK